MKSLAQQTLDMWNKMEATTGSCEPRLRQIVLELGRAPSSPNYLQQALKNLHEMNKVRYPPPPKKRVAAIYCIACPCMHPYAHGVMLDGYYH